MHISQATLEVKPTRQSFVYLLRETVLILAFLYLFLFNGTAADFVTLPVLQLTFGLLTLVAVAWLVAGTRGRAPLRPVLWIFLAVYFLACLTSIDPRRSLEEFGWLVFLFFLLILASDLVAHGWAAELIVKALLIAWTVVLAFAWIPPLMWYRGWLEAFPGQWIPAVVYRPDLPNTLAMSLNVALMLAAARWAYTRSVMGRVGLGLFILAGVALLYLTSSRAGWLGTAAGLACLALWTLRSGGAYLVGIGQGIWQGVKSRPLALAVGTLGMGSALVALAWLLYRQLQHPTHGPLLSSRGQFWEPAFETLRRYPLLGQGPNTLSTALLQAKTLGPGAVFVHAHSTPLNLAAETGLLGLLAGLGLAAGLAWALRRRWMETGGGVEASVVLGASAALASYAVHGLFDSFQTEPVGLWLLAAALGAALGQPAAPAPAPRSALARPWWVLGLVAAAWGSLWLVDPLFKGVEAVNSSRPLAAVPWLQSAAARDRGSAVAWQQLALAESLAAEQGDAAALARAVRAMEQAAILDSAWAPNLGNLGALYQAQGDLPAARRSLEAALDLADVPVFHLNLAVVAEAQGDLEMARREYSLAFENYVFPRLKSAGEDQGDPFWAATPLRQEVYQAWRLAQPSGRPAASSYSLTELEAALQADPSQMVNYLRLTEAYLAAGRTADAESLLRRAQFAPILDGFQDAWARRLLTAQAEQAGNTQLAEEYWQGLVVSCQMQGFSGPGESRTQLYAMSAFRKPAMYVELVPQMVRMPCW